MDTAPSQHQIAIETTRLKSAPLPIVTCFAPSLLTLLSPAISSSLLFAPLSASIMPECCALTSKKQPCKNSVSTKSQSGKYCHVHWKKHEVTETDHRSHDIRDPDHPVSDSEERELKVHKQKIPASKPIQVKKTDEDKEKKSTAADNDGSFCKAKKVGGGACPWQGRYAGYCLKHYKLVIVETQKPKPRPIYKPQQASTGTGDVTVECKGGVGPQVQASC